MKTTLYSLTFALIASIAAIAQSSTTTKTTTVKPDGSKETTVKTTTTKPASSIGTLIEFVPGTTFILKEKGGPVMYHYGKDVAYVTKAGTVITPEMLNASIRAGIPVSVDYTMEGDKRVISRVVVFD